MKTRKINDLIKLQNLLIKFRNTIARCQFTSVINKTSVHFIYNEYVN